MLLGFTEVLTVYFSVKPGEVTMEPTEMLPSHYGRIKPGKDKMTGLVEPVGPERI